MKIFITGASGFVGGAVAARLGQNHEVVAMSRSERSDRKLEALGVKPLRSELGAVKSEDLAGCEVVIHCAAFVGPWGSRAEFFRGNVTGTEQLLEAARAAGVRRFIHMGTEAAIFTGRDLVDIDEDYPYPSSNPYLYGSTKLEAEKLVLAANAPGFETLVLRPRLVWGPGDTSVLPVVRKMVEDGKFMWIDGGRAKTSTTCILNLVHAVELSLTRGAGGRVYFITDDETSTIREFLTGMLKTQNVEIPNKSVPGFVARNLARLVEGLWRLVGAKSEPPLMRFATDAMARQCTIRIDRARNELGYEPLVSVAEGMAAMRA